MLCLGYILLRYVLIYILEASYQFNLIFLQLNVIKMFTVQKNWFCPYYRLLGSISAVSRVRSLTLPEEDECGLIQSRTAAGNLAYRLFASSSRQLD